LVQSGGRAPVRRREVPEWDSADSRRWACTQSAHQLTLHHSFRDTRWIHRGKPSDQGTEQFVGKQKL